MKEGARVRTGLERCLEDPPEVFRRGKVGVLLNQASLDASFRPAHLALAERCPGHVAALFSPQHGLFGEKQDNMIESPHEREPELGIPVHSLYSDTRRPTPEMLAGLDALLVDLQDVGCRVYTFLATLRHALEACRDARIPLWVLDRPNPVGGVASEGTRLDPAWESFVGPGALPLRHGLTFAEAAAFLNASHRIGAELHVVPLEGWRREMHFPDTGLPWVPPSPNLPRPEGVLVYPGQVILEGTNLSEGRGTTTPFEVCGAPFVDGRRWVACARELDPLPGVVLRPFRFEPTFGKWQGERCGGVFLHVVDRAAFQPLRTALALLAAARILWPEALRFRDPPYEYETGRKPFDCILGGTRARALVEKAASWGGGELDELCCPDQRDWWRAVEGCLLYG